MDKLRVFVLLLFCSFVQDSLSAPEVQAWERKAVNKDVSGSFGKGNKMKNQKDGDNTGKRILFKVGNRKLGRGGLVKPICDRPVKGIIVVDVTVDRTGYVVRASVNAKESNISDSGLRNAALIAACQTQFNEVKWGENESGTIAYIWGVDATPALPVDPAPVEDPINTQEIEKSVVVKKDKPKEPKKKQPLTPEMLEKQKEEAERKKREREEALARKAVNKDVSGSFGKGNKMKNQKDGNDSGRTKGKTGGKAIDSGKGVSVRVGNRKLGAGGLIKPNYNKQAEGKVVVNVTVDPSGNVVSASINAGLSDTSNSGLRNAALAAAKKTKFNEIEGVDNETGTITYIFRLK